VEVFEEFKARVAVRRLKHGDIGVIAIETDGGIGPFSANGVAAEECQSEVGEEGDRRFEISYGDTDVLELIGMRRTLPSCGHLSTGCDLSRLITQTGSSVTGPIGPPASYLEPASRQLQTQRFHGPSNDIQARE
jgi:hypothetical protein